jgi:hypothetical protein
MTDTALEAVLRRENAAVHPQVKLAAEGRDGHSRHGHCGLKSCLVRCCSNSVRAVASQRLVAMCHKQTHAQQQSAPANGKDRCNLANLAHYSGSPAMVVSAQVSARVLNVSLCTRERPNSGHCRRSELCQQRTHALQQTTCANWCFIQSLRRHGKAASGVHRGQAPWPS